MERTGEYRGLLFRVISESDKRRIFPPSCLHTRTQSGRVELCAAQLCLNPTCCMCHGIEGRRGYQLAGLTTVCALEHLIRCAYSLTKAIRKSVLAREQNPSPMARSHHNGVRPEPVPFRNVSQSPVTVIIMIKIYYQHLHNK